MGLVSVAKASERYVEAQRERDKTYRALVRAIQAASEQGSSYSQIAEASGLSKPRIQQIVNAAVGAGDKA